VSVDVIGQYAVGAEEALAQASVYAHKSISILVNLSNDDAALVSVVCACIQVKNMASQMKPYFLSECFQGPR